MNNNSNVFYKVILVLFLSLFSSSFFSAEELDLKSCIDKCIENNPKAKQYRLLIKASEYTKKQNAAAIVPNIWFTSNFSYNYSVYNYDKNVAEYENLFGESNDDGDFGTFYVNTGLKFSLLSGIYYIPRYKIALENNKKITKEYDHILKELIYKVKETYYTILFIQEEIKILEEMTKRKEENLVLTKLLNNLDIENRAAANIIKAQIERYKFNIVQKNYSIDSQKKILLDLIGLDRKTEFTVKKVNENFPDYKLQNIIESGKKNSFELKEIEIQNNIYKYEINSLKLKAVPDLTFSFSYNYSNKPEMNYDNYFIFDLYFSLPLMNNLVNHYKIKEIDQTIKSNFEKKEFVVINLVENLKAFHDMYYFYKEEKSILENEYEYVFAYYEILKKKYRRGSIPYILLEDQEDKLFNLKLLIKNNIYNTRKTLARIEQYVNVLDM